MVSQFISPHQVPLLGDIDFPFPQGTHAIGRLDGNSEGLLLLTTDKKVTRLLFSSEKPHERTYLVQINNVLSSENLRRLQTGVSIRIGHNEYYTTPPCKVELIDDPQNRYAFVNDQKQYGPHTWLSITLNEGKFRQVRKMMAAIRHRCKRLIRISIEDMGIEGLAPGEIKEYTREEYFKKLKLIS